MRTYEYEAFGDTADPLWREVDLGPKPSAIRAITRIG